MRYWILAAGAVGLAAGLGSCTTMTAEQCMAGDWGTAGYRDGTNGYRATRLDDHATACAKVGVEPNVTAYMSAREDGLRVYCQPDNGFRVGRAGSTYNGVCHPREEGAFLYAYEDGRMIHAAEQALSSAESNVRTAESRIRDRERKLDAKERELRESGLSDDERATIRSRIREVRAELRDAHRDLERAELDLRDADRDVREVIRRVGSRYGVY